MTTHVIHVDVKVDSDKVERDDSRFVYDAVYYKLFYSGIRDIGYFHITGSETVIRPAYGPATEEQCKECFDLYINTQGQAVYCPRHNPGLGG